MKEIWNEVFDERLRRGMLVALIATTVITVLVGCLIGAIMLFTAGLWYFAIPCAFVMLFAFILAMLVGP